MNELPLMHYISNEYYGDQILASSTITQFTGMRKAEDESSQF